MTKFTGLVLALTVALGLLFVSATWAQETQGWYMEEYLETIAPADMPTRNGIIKTWYGAGKLKKDSFGQEVLIFRPDTKETFLLHPASRTYAVLPIEHMRMMAERSLAAYDSITSNPTAKPGDIYHITGRTKKIGAWNCQEIELKVQTVTAPGVTSRTTWWITNEAGVGPELLINIFRASMGDTKSPGIHKLFDAIATLDGFPVRQQTVTDAQGQKVTTTLTMHMIKKQKFDLSVFSVPEGYKRSHMPGPASPGMKKMPE